MGLWGLLVHVGNFVLPAVALGLCLAVGVVGWRGLALVGAHGRRLWRAWGLLAVVGTVVQAVGLAYFGVDGKMATYAALVLAAGSTAWWLQGRS